MTDTSDLPQEQKQRLEEWARSRAFGKVVQCCVWGALRCLPRRRFDLRGWRRKYRSAQRDEVVVYTQSPAAVVAMNLKNSHAALEAETLRKERDALAFEYAECQQELLEERESHCGTWQCAQDLLAKEDAAHAQTRGALARVLKERGSLERQLFEADWRMHLYRCACISLALIVLVEVIKHLVKAWQ